MVSILHVPCRVVGVVGDVEIASKVEGDSYVYFWMWILVIPLAQNGLVYHVAEYFLEVTDDDVQD